MVRREPERRPPCVSSCSSQPGVHRIPPSCRCLLRCRRVEAPRPPPLRQAATVALTVVINGENPYGVDMKEIGWPSNFEELMRKVLSPGGAG